MKNYLNIALAVAAAAITHSAFAPPASANIAQSYDIYLRRIINKTASEINWYEPVPGRLKRKEVYTKVRPNGETLLDKKINSMPYTVNVKNRMGRMRSITFNLVPKSAGKVWFLETTIRDQNGAVLDRTNNRVSGDFVYNMNIVVEGDRLQQTRVTLMSHEQTKPIGKPGSSTQTEMGYEKTSKKGKPESTLRMIIEAEETRPIGPPLRSKD